MKLFLCRGLAGAAVLVAATAAAQPERVSLNLMPSPNQTVRMDSGLDMDLNAEGPMALAVKMTNRSTMTMDVGALAADGSVTTKVTVSDAQFTATMNGSPMPIPAPSLNGTTMTMQYGPDGERKILDASGAVTPEALQQLMGVYTDTLAKAGTVGVGETVSVPINVPLPVPGGAGASAQNAVQGTLRLKLLGVDREGDTRIARFEQALESAVNSPSPDLPMQIKLTGTGTAMWNLTYGFQQAQDMTLNYDMAMGPAGSGLAIKGTMKTTLRGSRAAK